ncbi:protein SLC31A2-like isoform X1 [Pocillopora verrucosa]|uniref:protein SLC31A2-like isoform X1 n=1 Tax=Pocillopora verrucosa TaxID=203993 RepID=UPI00333EE101
MSRGLPCNLKSIKLTTVVLILLENPESAIGIQFWASAFTSSCNPTHFAVLKISIYTMTLNFVGEMQVLLRQWKVTSINGLGGSLIAVFSLAVLYEFMSSYHRYLGLPNGTGNTTKEFKGNKRILDHLLRTSSYLLSAVTGYLLMLVVNTFNVWLFMSVVVGLGFGFFLSNPLYITYRNLEVQRRTHDQRNNNGVIRRSRCDKQKEKSPT